MNLILVSYTELLPQLIQSQLLARTPLDPLIPPYSRWYDANASCDYHYRAKGHSTKNYTALKHKVQALMNARYVSFDFGKTKGPNVTSNLLPNHPRPKINALVEDLAKGVKTRVDDVKTPMEIIYEAFVQVKLLQPKEGKNRKEEGQSEEISSHY